MEADRTELNDLAGQRTRAGAAARSQYAHWADEAGVQDWNLLLPRLLATWEMDARIDDAAQGHAARAADQQLRGVGGQARPCPEAARHEAAFFDRRRPSLSMKKPAPTATAMAAGDPRRRPGRIAWAVIKAITTH